MGAGCSSADGMCCRLCRTRGAVLFCAQPVREFYRCPACGFIFVPTHCFISPREELSRYESHHNSSNDPGYRAYMESVAREIGKIPVANGRFLDFGCGKDAVLTDILRRGGHECTPYDPLYNYPLPAGADSYDCIVLCEVIEHLRDLRCEAALIRSLLAPQGYLFIRTELCSQRSDFNAWWYAQDCTHINFFTPSALETFGSLAGRDRWYTDEVRIAIFR